MSVTARTTTAPGRSLAATIVDEVDALICDAEQGRKPLEIDPCRSRLFELFVTADAAGLVSEDADPDLTADGLCRMLSERWGLRTAAEASLRAEAKMPADQLARMRSLWSLMRMWMEWTYAWRRWPEFHAGQSRA
jgi:hypothetical protein